MATPVPNPATLLVFGADSDTGFRLAQLARSDGRTVLGVVSHERDRARIERLGAAVAIADPTRREEVDALFHEQGVTPLEVVCFIGGTPQLNSQGNINVIDAAAAAGVRRFVLTTSIGCGDSAVVLDPFVMAFAGKSIRAKDWAEKRLRATNMVWSIVRSGGMHGRPTRGGAILVESPYVVGYINRSDLGEMVWKVLSSPQAAGRVYSAVDAGRALHIHGDVVVPANL